MKTATNVDLLSARPWSSIRIALGKHSVGVT